MKPININLIIFSMAGGLALFLFGMKVLSQGLQMAFGNKLRMLLEKLTNNKIGGVATGAVVTAIVQSSSITTVTLVGLINAGLITLAQSIPIIMGANIGTTITSQLIAFKVAKYSLAIIAVGFLLYSVSKRDSYKYAGQVILGFGILFLGMHLMSSEAKLLTKSAVIMNMLAQVGKVPVLGILSGIIFTAIVQSSSATSGLVISMGMENLLDLKAAILIILGANIGTCITVVFASIGSTLSSKRAALAHVLFNIVGVLIFILLLTPFISLVKWTSSDLARQIANAHVFFNIIVTALLLPLSGVLLIIVTRLIPGEEPKVEEGPRFLDKHTLRTPVTALAMAEKEAVRMAKIALSMIEASRLALFERSEKEIAIVIQKEDVVDLLDNEIEIFLAKIDKDALSTQQMANLAVLNHAISDIERIADHANNICELAAQRIKQKVRFSEEAFEELKDVFEKADQSLMLVSEVLMTGDTKATNEIKMIEKEVDKLVLELEDNHYERLNQGICTAKAGPIYLDILRNLERITDHTHNIACAKSIGF